MKKSLNTKNFVLIALLTALYIVIYFISMTVSSSFGAFGHAISPGISALLAGSIFIFLTRKVGKMWQFTIMIAILMAVFSIMGGAYLPWLISSMLGAFLADLIASRSNKPSMIRMMMASTLIHLGSALGGIIPSIFFAQQYYEDWVRRGQTPEQMEAMIKATQGSMAVLAIIVTICLSCLGIYLGWIILKKHLKED